MAQNLGSKKDFMRQVEERNNEAKLGKKNFTTKESPTIPGTGAPGLKSTRKK